MDIIHAMIFNNHDVKISTFFLLSIVHAQQVHPKHGLLIHGTGPEEMEHCSSYAQKNAQEIS